MVALNAVFAAGVHQDLSAEDIGRDEDLWILYRTVDMSFRGKVNDHVEFFFGKRVIDKLAVADIAFDKLKVKLKCNRLQGFQIAA